MKHFFYGVLIICSLASCRAGRHAKTIAEIPKTDTTANLIDSNKTIIEDSSAFAKNILKEILSKNFSYQSFYAKIKINFDDGMQNLNATLYIHLLKDSLIWVSITGPLNIEVSRILITKDSIKVMDKFEKIALLRGIDYLQDVTGLPVNFVAMEEMITGQPLFMDTTLESFSANGPNIVLNTKYKNILNAAEADTSSHNIIKYLLVDANNPPLRSCTINNSNFANSDSVNIPQQRNIIIHGDNTISINLEYKEFYWNENLSYVFKIPENYQYK